MRELLSGLAAGFSFVAALHFAKFAKRTGDRFFWLFAASFLTLAVHSAVLALVDPDDEARGIVYLLRLAAFAMILIAIWDKNHRRSP